MLSMRSTATIIARAFWRTEVDYNSAALNRANGEQRPVEPAFKPCDQREGMFVALFETTHYPMIAHTLDGTITAWNPAAERLYQHAAAEAIGSTIEMIIPPDRIEEYKAILEAARNDQPTEEYETVRRAKDGRRIDVSLCIRPFKSSTGEIVGLAKITRDLTAKRFAEEKFRLAVETCPSGMVIVDGEGKMVMVNAETERLFGYPRAAMIGRPVDMLVPARLRSQHAADRDRFVRQPETRRIGLNRDLFGARKDGTEFPVEVGLNPIQGEQPLVLSVIVDISERKRIEQLKDEFVSTVSHELRTPLTSIAASLGLLAGTNDVKPETTKHLIAIAHSNSQRLVRLINDILDIEKIESGKVTFNLQRLRCPRVGRTGD